MIYINSKNNKLDIIETNEYELMGAAKKADRILNFINGYTANISGASEWDDIVRYIQIVRDNLWEEVKRRNITQWEMEFDDLNFHLPDAEQKRLKEYIRQNFIPKSDATQVGQMS